MISKLKRSEVIPRGKKINALTQKSLTAVTSQASQAAAQFVITTDVCIVPPRFEEKEQESC
jgi:hypothetical protein